MHQFCQQSLTEDFILQDPFIALTGDPDFSLSQPASSDDSVVFSSGNYVLSHPKVHLATQESLYDMGFSPWWQPMDKEETWTRKKRSSTRPAAAWEESTVRKSVDERGEQRRTKSTAQVGRANSGTEGAARRGTRVAGGRDGKAQGPDTMPCVQKSVPQDGAEVKPVASSGGRAATAGREGARGAGAGGSEGRCGPHAGGRSPAAPLTDVLGGIRRGVVTLVSGEFTDGPARMAANGGAEEEERGRGRDKRGIRQGRATRGKWREDRDGSSWSGGAAGRAGEAKNE